jgi:hypothetical protein
MTPKAPGPFARAFRTFDSWLFSRLMQIGLVEDELLNVVALDGASDMTVSVHAANASTAKPPEKWACLLCGFLSRRVQKNHCQLVLHPDFVMPEAAALKAFAWITAALALAFGVPALMVWAVIRLLAYF